MDINTKTFNLSTFDIQEHDIYVIEEIDEAGFKTFQKSINNIVNDDNVTIERNIEKIKMCNFISNINEIKFKRPNINIFLNTFGGDIYSAFGYYDLLKSLWNRYDIHIHCYGKVMSAGTIILQGATKRIASPNTSFMIHNMSVYEFGQLEKVKNVVEHDKVLQNTMLNIYTERTKFNKKELEEIFEKQKDLYFTAEDALNKFGLIDEING